MEKRWDAYLAVALDGDDVEIQVDGHAGDIAQIAAMALADVIVQSSPEKEQAIKMLDDMKKTGWTVCWMMHGTPAVARLNTVSGRASGGTVKRIPLSRKRWQS